MWVIRLLCRPRMAPPADRRNNSKRDFERNALLGPRLRSSRGFDFEQLHLDDLAIEGLQKEIVGAVRECALNLKGIIFSYDVNDVGPRIERQRADFADKTKAICAGHAPIE